MVRWLLDSLRCFSGTGFYSVSNRGLVFSRGAEPNFTNHLAHWRSSLVALLLPGALSIEGTKTIHTLVLEQGVIRLL
jgi:hypothetical protein